MQNILKHKKFLLLIIIIITISLICGYFYYYSIDDDIKVNLLKNLNNYNIFNYNNIIKDLTIMSTILILSFFFIGLPLCITYLGYETFIIGFFINMFLNIYKIKGLSILLIYITIRVIPLFLIIMFLKKIINISKLNFKYLINREEFLKSKIMYNFYNSLYIIIFVVIINIVTYIFSKNVNIA